MLTIALALAAATKQIVDQLKDRIPTLTRQGTVTAAIAIGIGAAYTFDIQLVAHAANELGQPERLTGLIDNIVSGIGIGLGGGFLNDLVETWSGSNDVVYNDGRTPLDL